MRVDTVSMRKTLLISAILLAIVAAGCRSGADVVMWGPCTPGSDPTGTDGRYAMVCENGEWTPVMTADEFVRISRGERNVVIAPLPTRPQPTTTTSTVPTTTSTTTTSTTTTSTMVPLPPTITWVGPQRGTVFGGTSAVITGTNFSDTTAVTFGGIAAVFTVDSNTSITVTTPAHAAGAVDVVVTGSSGSATLVDGFEYVGPPTITSVSPTVVDAASSGTLTIQGTNLEDATVVQVGSELATIVGPTTDDEITVEYPPLPSGVHNVTVVTPHGYAIDAITAIA